jgi:pimeloyl-ACP methyl ester carboxylesterase
METTRSADGTRIAYVVNGSGPPLILVGGAFCDHRARAAGLPLARALEAHMTVICFDRRGRGESEDKSPYAVAREVEDLSALVAAAGGSASVYGHSSGAVIAVEAAAAGVPITRFALYEPPLVFADQRSAMPADLVEQLVLLTSRDQRSEAAELFLTQGVGVPAPGVERIKASPAWPSLTALAHTLSHDATLTRDPLAILERAASVTQPALLMAGEKSEPWMQAGVRRLAEAMKDARHATLAGQTHDVQVEPLSKLLLEFFGVRGERP